MKDHICLCLGAHVCEVVFPIDLHRMHNSTRSCLANFMIRDGDVLFLLKKLLHGRVLYHAKIVIEQRRWAFKLHYQTLQHVPRRDEFLHCRSHCTELRPIHWGLYCPLLLAREENRCSFQHDHHSSYWSPSNFVMYMIWVDKCRDAYFIIELRLWQSFINLLWQIRESPAEVPPQIQVELGLANPQIRRLGRFFKYPKTFSTRSKCPCLGHPLSLESKIVAYATSNLPKHQ